MTSVLDNDNDKTKFINSLTDFARTNGSRTPDGYGRIGFNPRRGLVALVRAFASYLEGDGVPQPEPLGLVWLRDLPHHLADAFVEFRTHDKWAALRATYRDQTGEEIPDFVDVHIGGLHRLLVVREFERLMPLLGRAPWLQQEISIVTHAQQTCIDNAWRAFVRTAYRQLMPRIKDESHRGNRGEFGSTTLLSYAIAGRVMFTFQRGADVGPSVTFVADDSDMYGFRSGPNATATPYAQCVAMIEEVTTKWSLDAFVRADSVKLAGM